MPAAKPIDLAELEKLAAMFCTDSDMARFFSMARETFNRRKAKSQAMRDAIEYGRGKGLVSLRKAQFDKARGGNPALLIWLGKQELGQKDRIDHTNDGVILLHDRLAAARQRLEKHREAEAARAQGQSKL